MRAPRAARLGFGDRFGTVRPETVGWWPIEPSSALVLKHECLIATDHDASMQAHQVSELGCQLTESPFSSPGGNRYSQAAPLVRSDPLVVTLMETVRKSFRPSTQREGTKPLGGELAWREERFSN